MKFSIAAMVAFAASAVSAGCTNDGGNWYCSATEKVIFKNVGFSGSYQDVTSMDDQSGQCTQLSKSFSGNLAPLDEELSVHFRGPIKLVQFGVYYPSSSSNSKRDDAEEECASTTYHQHHKHKRATQIVEVTQTVVVDGNGNSVTSQIAQTVNAGGSSASSAPANNNSPVSSAPDSSATSSSAASAADGASEANAYGVGKAYRSLSTSSLPTTTSAALSTASSQASNVPAGSWKRDSYYTPGTGDNVVFLNNHGGSGSGVWSSSFGNSLSYCNSDASGGSSTPVVLEETTLDSNTEFVIFSGSKCGGENDGDCGYYRKGTPAYHGFGGNEKIFVFEFSMPSDSGNSGFNGDMPAVWLLNAKIPRTLQYGKVECSCWSTGCGELDLFEILSSGSDKMIATLHDGQGSNGGAGGGGGSSDYFKRPTSGTFKGAAVFIDKEIHILQLDDNTDFGSSLDSDTVQSWISKSGSQAVLQG